jgi:hypothetical protein
VGNLTTEPKWNSDRRPNKRTGGLSTTETTVKLQRNQDAIRAIRYVFLAERQNEPKVTVRPPGPPPSHADRGMCFCEIQPQCQVLAERTQPVPTRMSLLGCPYLANAMAFRTRRRTERHALRTNRRSGPGKAHAWATTILFDEHYARGLQRPADGKFIGSGNPRSLGRGA